MRSTISLRTRLSLLVGGIAMAAVGVAVAVNQLGSTPSTNLQFSLAMDQRQAPPTSADAPTMAAYVNPGRWKTSVDACRSKAVTSRKGHVSRFQWTFTNGSFTKTVTAACRATVEVP